MTSGLVLVNGASGKIGATLRSGLREAGWQLRLQDIEPLGEAADGEELVEGDMFDDAVLEAAVAGVESLVHLAAIPTEAPYAEIHRVNIEGTYRYFEAARRAGVRRIVFAGSNHAVGLTPRQELAPADLPPRPDTYYGVSKVFAEALGRLYVDRYGMEMVSLRIGSFLPRPLRPRHLATWLSPGDTVRLVDAALRAPDVTFVTVWGISANTRGWWDDGPGRALGYEPQDDAEAYAAEVIAEHGSPDMDDVTEAFVGGEYAGPEFDF